MTFDEYYAGLSADDLTAIPMHATLPRLVNTDFPPLKRGTLETLQVNLGYTCNQSCLHCHVNAGPGRKEQMGWNIMESVLHFLQTHKLAHLDLTGGAPEMNPHFRRLVTSAHALGVRITDRCNLTILEEPGQEDLAAFLAHYNVEIIASLPCYLEENVDAQRGTHVFQRSIAGLRRLNALGYGNGGSEKILKLVFNPQGPQLPPPQQGLEQDYKRHLYSLYGVEFDQLLTLANMPIQRFGSTLISNGGFQEYMAMLKGAHRNENLAGVMCRSLISIDWQGYVYDCDFNQMLKLTLPWRQQTQVHIRDLLHANLESNPIRIADHCYGCTAGQGSSCGGALSI